MSLSDLHAGTFSTRDLVDKILSESRDILDPEADRKAGRFMLAERKEWLLAATEEYIRLRSNAEPKFDDVPDDTVRESER